MAATLFDHLRAITERQDPKYWDTLSESDRRTWSSYMIHRFLSMNTNWVHLIAEFQPYTEILEPRELYLCLIGIIPKGRHFSKYIKGKNENKYEGWLIDLVKMNYLCSGYEAEEYCEILYATKEGKEHIKYICEKYGVDPKMITRLNLKLK